MAHRGALSYPSPLRCAALRRAHGFSVKWNGDPDVRIDLPKIDWKRRSPLLTFLDTLDAAQRQLQNGDATAYKALWSHSDNVTLSGGFGGKIEKGWPDVSRRLDWAATQLSKGQNTIERVATRARGDLGYVIQIERIRFVVPGQTEESTRDYRVTMIVERTAAGWRVVHRHADAQTTKQPVN